VDSKNSELGRRRRRIRRRIRIRRFIVPRPGATLSHLLKKCHMIPKKIIFNFLALLFRIKLALLCKCGFLFCLQFLMI
jgi:hypothetical protein